MIVVGHCRREREIDDPKGAPPSVRRLSSLSLVLIAWMGYHCYGNVWKLRNERRNMDITNY